MAAVRRLVHGLEERRLLLDTTGTAFADSAPPAAEFDFWRGVGWRAAAAYHLQTYGYEFETYQPDGSSDEDARRMFHYGGAKAQTSSAARLPAGGSAWRCPFRG